MRETVKKHGGGKANWGTWKDELEDYTLNQPFVDQNRQLMTGSPVSHIEVKSP